MSTDKTNVQRLLERVEADGSHLMDPLVVAAEAAKHVVDNDLAKDTKTMLQALNEVLPQNVSVLERGLAVGMVLGLQTAEATE